MSQADKDYMDGRQQYKTGRPQAVIWADKKPTIADNRLVPVGYEIGVDTSNVDPADLKDNRFLILSDHNRSALDLSIERIEQKKRMVNGTMRSYHVADKVSLSVSWDMLPSRSFKNYPTFNDLGNPNLVTSTTVGSDPAVTVPVVSSGSKYFSDQKYTVDGGAGGVELLDWYESHKGPFWVMLSYDKYNVFEGSLTNRTRLSQYSQELQMYVSNFSYSVIKRGAKNFDMWNISVTLEEV